MHALENDRLRRLMGVMYVAVSRGVYVHERPALRSRYT